ncbi:hypothetical protein AX14_004065 [Amanita brunnescens Koide BX004]|nr:hypothetical protein AX14_004065 [Amanita brunnescens Koide BX004]
MAQNCQVLVDDQDPNVEYLCDVTTLILPDVYYNDTWTSVASPMCGYGGWFRYSFIGTGVQISIPVTSNAQQVFIQIDNRPHESLKGTSRYVSPDLADGTHNITVFAGETDVLSAFDYLTYTAGPSTSLYEKIIIQNDNDAALNYRGDWSVQEPGSAELDDTLLYKGTAHWSRTVGDTISYQFTGTSITVMGVSTPSEMNASLTFTLDGNTTLQMITQTNLTRTSTVRFFHGTDLEPTQHTLNINVTNISASGPIGIDFFAYNTSFSSLSQISASFEGGTIPREKILFVMMTGIIAGLSFALGFVICFSVWKRQRGKRFTHQFEMRAKGMSYGVASVI